MVKKIVLIGGGFAGLTFIKKLKKDKGFEIVLIDSNEQYYHKIGSHRASLDGMYREEIFFNYPAGVSVVNNTVKAIKKSEVILADGKGFYFDILVVATGSTYNMPVPLNNGVGEIRKSLSKMQILYKKAQRIIIVGGGPIGVELAGEVRDAYPDKLISLYHHDVMLLNDKFSTRLRKSLEKQLIKKRVEIILGVSADINELREIPDSLVVLATGARPPILIDGLEASQDGYYRVDKFLQSRPHIYVIGDSASLSELKTGINAGKQAKWLAKNIRKLENGQNVQPYKESDKVISIIPIGKHNGGMQVGKIVLGKHFAANTKGKDLLLSQSRKRYKS